MPGWSTSPHETTPKPNPHDTLSHIMSNYYQDTEYGYHGDENHEYELYSDSAEPNHHYYKPLNLTTTMTTLIVGTVGHPQDKKLNLRDLDLEAETMRHTNVSSNGRHSSKQKLHMQTKEDTYKRTGTTKWK